jgi:hypothetical protein
MKDFLNYNSTIKLIFDLIFRKKSVNKLIKARLENYGNNIRKVTEAKLNVEFKDKLAMLRNDYTGIVESKFDAPVLSVFHSSTPPYPEFPNIQGKHHQINTLHQVFEDCKLPIDYIKQEAARNFAKELIKRNILNAKFDGNKIVFTVKFI